MMSPPIPDGCVVTAECLSNYIKNAHYKHNPFRNKAKTVNSQRSPDNHTMTYSCALQSGTQNHSGTLKHLDAP